MAGNLCCFTGDVIPKSISSFVALLDAAVVISGAGEPEVVYAFVIFADPDAELH